MAKEHVEAKLKAFHDKVVAEAVLGRHLHSHESAEEIAKDKADAAIAAMKDVVPEAVAEKPSSFKSLVEAVRSAPKKAAVAISKKK